MAVVSAATDSHDTQIGKPLLETSVLRPEFNGIPNIEIRGLIQLGMTLA